MTEYRQTAIRCGTCRKHPARCQCNPDESSPVDPFVRWVVAVNDAAGIPIEWRLIVGKLMRRRKQRCVATIWVNISEKSATWHTWNADGEGGQNDVEADAVDYRRAVRRAKANAGAAAIEQGFI